MAMSRRHFLGASALLASAAGLGTLFTRGSATAAEGDFPVSFTREEWRERLSAKQFNVLRDEGTEAPYSSPLNDNKRAGIYSCAGCDNPVYSSETKFDSGTGWPSFWAPISQDAVGTTTDYKLIYPRTEVHCARCGGHLGHVFDDGPAPTGKRHCINGVALAFAPGEASAS